MNRILSMIFAVMANMASADGRSGDFDYYVMALSWSPNWCAREGDARNSPQCDQDFGWVLHGLWPQYDDGGYPDYCQSGKRPPSRRDTAERADLFGTSGSAWHQWNKHGSCSGLSPDAYYDLSQDAYDSIERPDVLRRLQRRITVPANVIEDAFLEANPNLGPEQVVVTCRDGGIQEVRVCLDKDLSPRQCSPDVARACRLSNAWLEPIK